MAKHALFMAILVSCILLVMVSHAEAQKCKTINRTDLLKCASNVNTGQCVKNTPCYNFLAIYKNEPGACICKFVNTVTSAGISKNKIKTLLVNCKFGRTYPKC